MVFRSQRFDRFTRRPSLDAWVYKGRDKMSIATKKNIAFRNVCKIIITTARLKNREIFFSYIFLINFFFATLETFVANRSICRDDFLYVLSVRGPASYASHLRTNSQLVLLVLWWQEILQRNIRLYSLKKLIFGSGIYFFNGVNNLFLVPLKKTLLLLLLLLSICGLSSRFPLIRFQSIFDGNLCIKGPRKLTNFLLLSISASWLLSNHLYWRMS